MQIVILGFHRSGTSAISQHLSLSGLNIGTDLLGPKFSNPFGHFEDSEIVNLNQQILRQNNENWLTSNQCTYIFLKEHLGTGLSIVSRRDAKYADWGFKDPRTCLLLDFWNIFLSEPRYVVCLRHYLSCIDSIFRREFASMSTEPVKNKALIYSAAVASPDEVCLSWCNYNAALLHLLKSKPDLCTTFQVSELTPKASIALSLHSKYGIDLQPKPLIDTFEPKFFKKNVKLHLTLSESVKKYADSIWSKLLDHCTDIDEVRQ